jgi:hypothetical protein
MMETEPRDRAIKPYDHDLNIQVGKGRILFDTGYGRADPAWVLPGGRRTTDEVEARAAAVWMDQNAQKKLIAPR